MFSAGTYGSARRIRAATISGVSTSGSARSSTPNMIFLPASGVSALQSRFDCAVSIETCRQLQPASSEQEGIPRRPRMDDRGIAETDVHGGGAGHALERLVERVEPERARFLGPRLHVGLVDLHDVGAGSEQVADLLVHCFRVVQRGRFAAAAVAVDLRLLRHRERPRHGDLHLPVGVRAQEFEVFDLHRVFAADLAHDARHRIRMTAAIERAARVVEIHAFERGGETIRIAFAADLAIGDDVEPGLLPARGSRARSRRSAPRPDSPRECATVRVRARAAETARRVSRDR